MSPCTSAFRTSYGFRRQLPLFVVWTFSSSTRDAGRQVSTPSAFAAWLGITILQASPNLTRFQLTVADQLGKSYRVEIARSDSRRVEQVFDLLWMHRNVSLDTWVHGVLVKNLFCFDQFRYGKASSR